MERCDECFFHSLRIAKESVRPTGFDGSRPRTLNLGFISQRHPEATADARALTGASQCNGLSLKSLKSDFWGTSGSLRARVKRRHQYLVPHRSDTDSSTDDPVEGAPLAVSPLKLYSGRNFPQFSLLHLLHFSPNKCSCLIPQRMCPLSILIWSAGLLRSIFGVNKLARAIREAMAVGKAFACQSVSAQTLFLCFATRGKTFARMLESF